MYWVGRKDKKGVEDECLNPTSAKVGSSFSSLSPISNFEQDCMASSDKVEVVRGENHAKTSTCMYPCEWDDHVTRDLYLYLSVESV
jgi:hypothetical protein